VSDGRYVAAYVSFITANQFVDLSSHPAYKTQVISTRSRFNSNNKAKCNKFIYCVAVSWDTLMFRN